ncbi:MAG TPA: aldo/keto reductase [Ignavibacteriaceae bacterium]|nr:aldo/keto reductase [Ignavibacteriaceae bacterium]
MLKVPARDFGSTGFKVSAVGLGCGQIGHHDVPDSQVETLLNYAYENGITLFDTARGYGLSEERLGRFIKDKRDRIILSTKVGYGIEGVPDWTFRAITDGVDEALKRMNTDYIDIVHLHSCSFDLVENNGLAEALLRTKHEGKIRAAAYSGENEDLSRAIKSGFFDSIQTSVNITDQRSLLHYLSLAEIENMGIIAKRPLANVFWKHKDRPYNEYSETYWLRWKEMNLNIDMDMNELATRFSVFAKGVSSAITGTSKMEHLQKNIENANKGSLPEEITNLLIETFKAKDNNWRGDT